MTSPGPQAADRLPFSEETPSDLPRSITFDRRAFTLFEVMIALAVFVIASLGIAQALKSTIDVAIMARDRVILRTQLESRLAFCLAEPPRPGAKRQIKSQEKGGVQFEETLIPYLVKNAEDQELANLFQLTIVATQNDSGKDESEKISLVIYRPEPFREGPEL